MSDPKSPKPGPVRPRVSKVHTRNMIKVVSRDTKHTSFRLDHDDRRLMRLIGKKCYGDGNMSFVVRMLIRERAAKEDIK